MTGPKFSVVGLRKVFGEDERAVVALDGASFELVENEFPFRVSR